MSEKMVSVRQAVKKTKSSLIYYDIIYNPEETMLIKKFKKRKIQTINGLDMFIFQGQKSFSLWNKTKPEFDEELRRNIMEKLK